MKHAIMPIALLVTCLAGQVPAAQTVAQQQTSFCEDRGPEDLTRKPVPLPSAIVTTLMNTTEGKEASKVRIDGKIPNPSTLFKGTRVRLADSGGLFFVVMGSFPMTGADNTWLWVVRQSGNRATVLLFTGANCLEISPKTTLGYRDIETTWSSASTTRTETYTYTGKSYKLQHARSRPNKW